MKKHFPGYYKLTEDEQTDLWKNCKFVLDANTLLNLLRYPKETSNVMLSLLENIKERIWIPHQVAIEYHRNLDKVIYEQKNEYETLEKECMTELQKLVSKLRKLQHSNISTDSMIETLEKSSEIIKKELANQREKQPDLNEIKLRISDLVGENIGSAFDQAELDRIFTEGAQRYENKVPPGYMDGKKNYSYFHNGIKYQAAYGDLIFWKQILRYAQNEKVMSIILVSDDRKEDWILEVSGEKKGIHPYLINEFNSQCGGKIFNSYNSVQFISQAEKFLGFESSATVSDVIKEIETVYDKEDSNKINEMINLTTLNKSKERLIDAMEGRVIKQTIKKNNEKYYYYYKLCFEVNDTFVKTETENPVFPVLLQSIIGMEFQGSNIVEIDFHEDIGFIYIVFAVPYLLSNEAVTNLISREIRTYYHPDELKLLKMNLKEQLVR